MNFLMFKLVLEKAEEPEIKLPTSTGSWKKQESSRKTSISALLTMPKPLTVWITISIYYICIKKRNLYKREYTVIVILNKCHDIGRYYMFYAKLHKSRAVDVCRSLSSAEELKW